MAQRPTRPTLPGEAAPTLSGEPAFNLEGNESMAALADDEAQLASAVQDPDEISKLLSGHTDDEPFVPSDQDALTRPVATTGPTVTVACKVPCGLVLQLSKWEETSEEVMGGGRRMVRRARRTGQTVRLNGFANPVNGALKTVTYGGYGITYGVPKDFWDEWCRQNEDSDLLEKNMLFALDRSSDAQLEAKRNYQSKSGFEPLDPAARVKVGAFTLEQATKE